VSQTTTRADSFPLRPREKHGGGVKAINKRCSMDLQAAADGYCKFRLIIFQELPIYIMIYLILYYSVSRLQLLFPNLCYFIAKYRE
jgi:hypothetical protein